MNIFLSILIPFFLIILLLAGFGVLATHEWRVATHHQRAEFQAFMHHQGHRK